MPRRRRDREEGAALIMVVVVIAALLVIAAPFVVSMRLHEKSSQNFASELRAKQLATAGRNNAVARLLETHPDEERRARMAANDSSDPEGVDGLDEIRDAERFAASAQGVAALDTGSATGSMVQVSVTDARARLDVNTCGPGPIANLLGVTVTTEVLDFESTKGVTVETTRDFFSDGDPRTIDGIIRIGGEECYYRHTTPTAFQGLTRGANFTRMNNPEEDEIRRNYHPAGTLVQDARGYKIALDPLWRTVGTDREGQLVRFESPAGVRRIADWEFATQRAAWYLFGKGLNLKSLRSLGISKEQILDAGMRVEDFDKSNPDRSEETADERRLRHKAEKALSSWGLSVKEIRERGGDQGVLRLYTTLKAMKTDERNKLVAVFRQRQEKRKDATVQLDSWQKQELKRNFVGLTEARNEAPNLETIGRIELEEKLRPFITTDAPPEGEAWSDPQVVNHIILYNPDAQAVRVQVQDARRFRRGWPVRIHPLPRADGLVLPDEYRLPFRVQRNTVVGLFPQLDTDYQQSAVEISCRQPRPINVNTASRIVLRAVLTGLQSRAGQRASATGGNAPNIVTPTQAAAIADAIVARDTPLTSPADLRALLLELRTSDAIDDHDVDAVYRNALDPADPRLRTASVPFTYRSGDVYEVRATGIVNDPSGLELARHTYEDVIQVAPPRELTWSIDSQRDMTDRISVPGGPRRDFRDRADFIFLPGRWQNLMLTRPAPSGPYLPTPFFVPPASHAAGQGDFQPQLSKLPDVAAGTNDPPTFGADPTQPPTGGPTKGRLELQENNGSADGQALSAQSLSGAQLGTRHYLLNNGATHTVLGPGCVRGWYRFDRLPSGSEKAFLFDGGVNDTVDRVSLYLQDGDLVFAVHDEAMDAQESLAAGTLPRAQELRYTPTAPFQEGNWYHVAAFYKGLEPGDMALAVDGRYVGGQPTIGTRLTAAIDNVQNTLTVEDASAFPPFGYVRIGASRYVTGPKRGDRGVADTSMDANQYCEVLEYISRSGNTLRLATQTPVPATAQSTVRIQAETDRFSPEPRQRQRPRHAPPTLVPGQAVRQPIRGSGISHRVEWQNPPAQPGGPLPMLSVGQANLGFPHEAGTIVMPYGYHARVTQQPAQIVRDGGLRLAQALPQNTPATVLYVPNPGGGYNRTNQQSNPTFDDYPQVVDALVTTIPVLWAPPYAGAGDPPAPKDPRAVLQPGEVDPVNVTGGWPSRGIVRISSFHTSPNGTVFQSVERVYYRGIRKIGNTHYELTGCARGVAGTPAAPHVLFATVVLESIELNGDPGDPAGTSSVYTPRVDIGDPRVYASLSRPLTPADPTRPHARSTEWLSIQQLNVQERRQRLDNANLLLIPARDSLQGTGIVLPPGIPTGLQPYTPERDPGPGQVALPSGIRSRLRNLLLDDGGTFPDPDNPSPSQGLFFDFQPTEPVSLRGQMVKEVLKRWEPSFAPLKIYMNPGTFAGSFGFSWKILSRGARRAKGTTTPEGGHPVGTQLLPTFSVDGSNGSALLQQQLSNPQVFFYSRGGDAGPGDVVTITDDQAGVDVRREEATIVHAAPSSVFNAMPAALSQILNQFLGLFGARLDDHEGWLIAFDNQLTRTYSSDANARIARWPVGNLQSRPSLVFGRARPTNASEPNDVVADAPGALEGVVDDLLSMQLEEEVLVSRRPPLGSGGVVLGPTPGGNGQINRMQRGRLYLTDAGEVLATRDAQQANGPAGQGGNWMNVDLVRGALGTATPQGSTLGPETALWRLSWPPVAIAEGGFGGSRSQRIPVRNPEIVEQAFRQGLDGGYLARDRGAGAGFGEVFAYTQKTNRQRSHFFERPVDRFNRARFRSAFGSPQESIAQGDLLVDLPFRAHDRYGDRVSSLDSVFFQFSRELPGSLITRIEWDEQLWTPFNEVKVAVRLDGAPSWDARPTKTPGMPGRLYVFDDPAEPNRILLRANRVEVRVSISFKAQAFERDAWKRGALVGGLRIKYRQPTRTLRREERTQ